MMVTDLQYRVLAVARIGFALAMNVVQELQDDLTDNLTTSSAGTVAVGCSTRTFCRALFGESVEEWICV